MAGFPPVFVALIDITRWLALLTNTFVVCGIALAVAWVLGVQLGLMTARTDTPGRRVIGGAAILGACVPVYVSAIFLFALVPQLSLAKSAVACGLLYGVIYTPLAVVVLGTVLRSADRELEEQALLEAGMRTVLLRITIPQAAWGLAALAMIVILFVATDFTIPDILMVRTFAEEVYTQYALNRSQVGPLLTSLPVLSVMAVLLIVVQLRYRVVGENSPWQFGTPPRTISLGPYRWPVGIACVLLVGAAVGAPAVALVRRIGSIEGFLTSIVAVEKGRSHQRDVDAPRYCSRF